MLILSGSIDPFVWFKNRLVFQSFMVIFKYLMIAGDSLQISNAFRSCSKINHLFVTFLVTLTYAEINFGQYLQLESF